MKLIAENTEKLIILAPEVGGVFSLMELSSLFDIIKTKTGSLFNAF